MPRKSNDEWLEKLAKWQGKIDNIVVGLNKNDDEHTKQLNALWKAHNRCREEILGRVTSVMAGAEYRQGRWANIDKIIIAVISAILTAFIIKLWPI